MAVVEMEDDSCQLQLRSNDFDWGGHLNNSVYFQLFEYGRWSWGSRNDIDLRNSDLVAVVVRADVEFIKPVEWNPIGKVDIITSLEKLESFSFYLRQTVASGDKIHADASIRLGLLDIKRNKIVKVNLMKLKGGVYA